jgi:hypothetical protein
VDEERAEPNEVSFACWFWLLLNAAFMALVVAVEAIVFSDDS